MRALALMMSYVALAVLDVERHSLEGVVAWYHGQFASAQDEARVHRRQLSDARAAGERSELAQE